MFRCYGHPESQYTFRKPRGHILYFNGVAHVLLMLWRFELAITGVRSIHTYERDEQCARRWITALYPLSQYHLPLKHRVTTISVRPLSNGDVNPLRFDFTMALSAHCNPICSDTTRDRISL